MNQLQCLTKSYRRMLLSIWAKEEQEAYQSKPRAQPQRAAQADIISQPRPQTAGQ